MNGIRENIGAPIEAVNIVIILALNKRAAIPANEALNMIQSSKFLKAKSKPLK